MKDNSRKFLEQRLPEALELSDKRKVLQMLYELINEEGFAPPNYDEYNDFGREAQEVYNDILYESSDD